jgi:hypothetical protein
MGLDGSLFFYQCALAGGSSSRIVQSTTNIMGSSCTRGKRLFAVGFTVSVSSRTQQTQELPSVVLKNIWQINNARQNNRKLSANKNT